VQEVEASPCEGKLELIWSMILCVASLQLGGQRRKKSIPSVGWEVSVKSSNWKEEARRVYVSLEVEDHLCIYHNHMVMVLLF
jgi:hypothetical protein